MLKLNKKGQNSFVEYATTFFLVTSIITMMGLYIRRVLQGRTRDALHYMASTVQADYPGNFRFQYEPYYANSTSIKFSQTYDVMTEQGAYPIGAGIVDKVFNHQMIAIGNQIQLPPAFSD